MKTEVKTEKGFSMVEFMVIMSIFAIMAGVALFNFSGFNTAISLNNLAHDIALTVHQAKVFGSTATTNTNLAPGITSSQTIGTYFQYDQTSSNLNFEYLPNIVVFNDTNTTGVTGNELVYDPIADIEIDQKTINTTDGISNICVGAGPPPDCSYVPTDIHITFTRPLLDATIMAGNVSAALEHDYALIELLSPNSGRTKGIEVWHTGQISVVDL